MAFDTRSIFTLASEAEFHAKTMELFAFQYQNNPVYAEFCDHLGVVPKKVEQIDQIPFLPIEFFKSKTIQTTGMPAEITFTSSGTTGSVTSRHHVADLSLYEMGFRKAFERFYGPLTGYCILALLPSYLEREGSSLVYMAQDLISGSKHPESGFYLNDLEGLKKRLQLLESQGQKTLLLGVTYDLLDLVEAFPFQLKHTIVMETGGMKGKRKELVREALHAQLCAGFGVDAIHSEYGMTELLSQAYSDGSGIFHCPPWMRVLIRDTEDPLSYQALGKTGGINIIDLANAYSCPFIATQDLGKGYEDGSFEVLGRFDHADIRGCNLMVV